MTGRNSSRRRGTYRSPLVSGRPGARGGDFLFILVEPASPGNIGAACRAIKTMGFTRMAVVRGPRNFKYDQEAIRLAHNAGEILDAVTEFDAVEPATAGLHHLIGTTHRPRAMQFLSSRPVREASEFAVRQIMAGDELFCGVLFGSERRGLTDEELALCQDVATVPAAVMQPSLNLAQAVQIVAYEIYLSLMGLGSDLDAGGVAGGEAAVTGDAPPRTRPPSMPTVSEIQALIRHIEATLDGMGFANRHSGPERFRGALIRMLSRANLRSRDLRLIHRLLQQADRFVADHSRKEAGSGDSNSRTRPSG